VIDTHAHLDAFEDVDEAIERARAAGVGRIITVGTDAGRWHSALDLAERHEGVFAVLGIHPHNAADDSTIDGLRETLDHERAVAVGETGLDYYRDYAPRDRQQERFESQLALARELDKTVVIHTRAADDDVAAALAGHEGTIVLHCFSSPRLLRPALEHGWYVSFAGNVTYKNASELRLAATQVPSDRLLVETDSPYLAPQERRGRRNEPAYVVHTLAALAAARGDDPDELEATIDENATRAFALP
jgi:TatD DNase family protein